MSISPEKMQALKEKYALDDAAIEEIANAAEPKKVSVQEIAEAGEPRESTQQRPGGIIFGSEDGITPEFLKGLGNGDTDMKDVINTMLVMEMIDDRRERRTQRNQPPGDSNKELIEEMRRDREETNRRFTEMQTNTEKLILGKQLSDVSAENVKLNEALRERDKKDEEKRSYDQLRAEYDSKLNDIVGEMRRVPPERQKSFLDEIFTGITGEIQNDVKTAILERFRGTPSKGADLIKTDEKGAVAIDYGAALNRTFDTIEKAIEAYQRTHGAPGTAPPPLSIIKERELAQGNTGTNLPPQPQPIPPPQLVTEQPNIVAGGSYERVQEDLPQITPGTIYQSTRPELSLRELNGIDPDTEARLGQLGIRNAKDLSMVDPEQIRPIVNEKANDLVKQAKDLVDRAA